MVHFKQAVETLCHKYLLQYKILCMKSWHAMCIRENNNVGSKQAYKWACQCYCFSWCKLSLIHGKEHLPKAGMLQKVITVFHRENLVLFTVNSIHSIQKYTKHINSETRWKVTSEKWLLHFYKAAPGSNSSKDREIELINKKLGKKRKGVQ